MERSWYVGVNVGKGSRYLDLEFTEDGFKMFEGLFKNKPDPKVPYRKLWNDCIVVGFRDVLYGTLYLGYRWKKDNLFIGVEGSASIEPYNLEFELGTSAERRLGKGVISLNANNIIVGGLVGKFGYYLAPSTAIIALAGLELGAHGNFVMRSPLTPEHEDRFDIPDGGLRLGLEMKTHLNKRWSMNLGFHKTFVSTNIIPTKYGDRLKELGFSYMSFEKTRCYIGLQYDFKIKEMG